MCSATRPRTRRNDGVARQLPVRRGAIRDCRPLDAIFALPLPAVPEGAWRAIPHAGAGRRRRFPLSRRRGACLVLRVDAGHAPRLLQSVRRADAGEISRNTRAARRPTPAPWRSTASRWLRSTTTPASVPTRTRLSSTRRRGSRSPMTFPNTQRVSPARTHHTVPDRPITAIPIARVAAGVQNHKQA